MSNVFKLPLNSCTKIICPKCEANKWDICITKFDIEPKISSTDLACLECGFIVGVLMIMPEDYGDDDDDD